MNQEVKYQVRKALGESDLILFVVDGKEGLSPHDLDIGNLEIEKIQ